MIQPSFSEQSDNNSIPETKLPGQNLTSLNELKDHSFDPDSNAPAFYWSEHKLSGSGVRNLTAQAFSLHTEQVPNAEAWFSLTISNLLIQLTESQRELIAQCMLHAANSKHPQLSIFEHTHVPTSEDNFQNIIYLDQTLLYLIFLIPFLRQLQMGHILFCWFNRSSCK